VKGLSVYLRDTLNSEGMHLFDVAYPVNLDEILALVKGWGVNDNVNGVNLDVKFAQFALTDKGAVFEIVVETG
jgi:hypothetical protein